MESDNITKSLGVENYSIEQQKTKEDIMAFLLATYKNARQVAEDTVHQEIGYCRNVIRTRHGVDYVGHGSDDETYDEDSRSLKDTRRFRSSMCNQKNKQIARKQTRNRPKMYVRIADTDEEKPELQAKIDALGGKEALLLMVQRLFDDWWEKNGIDQFAYKIVKSAHDEGTAMTTMWWDSEKRGGEGDAVWRQIRPENYYPEPGVEDISDLNYQYLYRKPDLRRAVMEFGAAAIKAANNSLEEQKHDTRIEEMDSDEAMRIKIAVVDAIFRDNSTIYMEPNGEEITKKQYERINNTLDQLEMEQGGDYSTLRPMEQKLYPNGRILTFSGSTLLRDETNPLGFNPFGKYTPNAQAFSFWGEPTTRDMAPIQENFDKIIQMEILNLFLFGMPKLFIKDGNFDKDLFIEMVGQIIPIPENAPLNNIMYYHPGSSISNDATHLANIMQMLVEDISGVHAPSEGKAGAAKSGRMTIAMQEMTHEFLAQPARAFEIFLESECKKILSLLCKYSKAGRKYEYQNEAGERVVGQLPFSLAELDIVFDFVISPGSSLPEDRESKANRALMLHQADPLAFNTDWLIKEIGYDNDPELTKPALQYESLKRNTMQMIEKAGGNPQQVQQMVQEQKIHPEMLQTIVQQLTATREQQELSQAEELDRR